jgi:hypothetical protein
VTGVGPLDDCRSVTPIRFAQRNNINFICYKSLDPSDLPAPYRAIYKGPCVLVRRGPPHKPNDDLDSSAASNVQVLMDGLAKPSSSCASVNTFRATLGVTSTDGGDLGNFSILRNANITITMDSPRETYAFSVRSPSSPAYDGIALYRLCTTAGQLGCGRPGFVTNHYKPLMSSPAQVIANTRPDKENIFYFEYPFSEYVLSQDSGSGTCTYSQCHVSRNGVAVKMNNVDGLIFSDKQIRVFD